MKPEVNENTIVRFKTDIELSYNNRLFWPSKASMNLNGLS